MDRRKFIKNVATASAATFVLPRFSIAQTKSPNSKLNVAFVGVGGVGGMAIEGMSSENAVAFCDVDDNRFWYDWKKWPKAKRFHDYREMLDKMGKDIDAVCVSTPDHSHFKITIDAMQCGKHVCVQKPLVHNIWQCRELERARKYYKVQTQMMNQGHATEGIRLLKEWYDTGIAGAVREVHVMCGGPNWWNGNPKMTRYFCKPFNGLPLQKQPVPKNLKWDLWLNQGKYSDYNEVLAPLSWRGFWDYGTGMLGDWFCHTGDAPVWALDLKGDCTVELLEADCSYDPKVFIPNSSTVKWSFPKTDKREAVDMYWYDGAKQPITTPKDLDKGAQTMRSGMYMIGDKHTLEHGARPDSPRFTNSEFFKEFKRSGKAKDRKIPRVRNGSLYCEWIDAIKGDGPEAGSNFSYASQITEVALLGALAQRFGGKLEWDSKNMCVKNRPELAPFIKEPVRAGWESKDVPTPSFWERLFG